MNTSKIIITRMMMMLLMTVTLLLVSSVGQSATTGPTAHAHMSQPEFGPAPNVTRVQVDSTAFLHCNVLNMQEDNQVGSEHFS